MNVFNLDSVFRFKFKGQLYLQVLLFQNQDKAGAVELLHCRTNREALTGFSGSEDALAEFENNKSDQSPIPVCSTFFFVSRHHHTFAPTATAKCAKNTTKKNTGAQILTGRKLRTMQTSPKVELSRKK